MARETHADVCVLNDEPDETVAASIADRLNRAGLTRGVEPSTCHVTLVVWTPAAAHAEAFADRVRGLAPDRTLHVRLRPCELPAGVEGEPLDLFGWRPGKAHSGWTALVGRVGDLIYADGAESEGEPTTTRIPPARPAAGGVSDPDSSQTDWARYGVKAVLVAVALFATAAVWLGAKPQDEYSSTVSLAWMFTPLFAAPVLWLLVRRKRLNEVEAVVGAGLMTAVHYGAIQLFLFIMPLTFAVTGALPGPVFNMVAIGLPMGLAGGAAAVVTFAFLLLRRASRPRGTWALALKVAGVLAVVSLLSGTIATVGVDRKNGVLVALAIYPVWQLVYGLAIVRLSERRPLGLAA